ncbi:MULTISPECIES: LysE family translocator [Ramlibacter]|uniref:LysE family translocator n=1 Tax=Ramlibacter aquaticus TaxID=2780094 RepID=A0ABR9SDH0_9BURK|nr:MULTISPECIES: LysE family translocator [Ramlibacter]MBE7940401.1 LysE family translocator [Ramlibacter aquaticus]
MDLQHLLVFVAAGLLLNLAPGPDVVFIVTQSVRGGVRAGIAAAAGITAGCFVHILAAALGLSALVAASATAFTVLKWVGAAYLVWVGLKMLRSRGPAALAQAGEGAASPLALRQVFVQGFGTNVLNPKVALFFLAFLPQFITPAMPHKTLAFLGLGLLFNFNALWVDIGWALAAAWLARRVGAVRRVMGGLERVAGCMFLAFGLKLALTDNPSA